MSDKVVEATANGIDRDGNTYIAWQRSDGGFMRAWIVAHGFSGVSAGSRYLFSARTETLGGEPIGEPAELPVHHGLSDWETLRAFVRAEAMKP